MELIIKMSCMYFKSTVSEIIIVLAQRYFTFTSPPCGRSQDKCESRISVQNIYECKFGFVALISTN